MAATIITSQGRLLETGDGKSGLIIMDETGEREILAIDETSDDDIINLFLKPVGKSSGIIPGETDRWYEILMRRLGTVS